LIRIIKPGPRPFIMLGAVFGVLLAVMTVSALSVPISQSLETLKSIGFILFLFSIISFNVWRTRIVISQNSILLQRLLGTVHEIKFKDITGSVAGSPAEPRQPVTLNIYVKDHQWPALSLLLKPYRQKDISWLLQLPELKVDFE
jgi:hypothetical protein